MIDTLLNSLQLFQLSREFFFSIPVNIISPCAHKSIPNDGFVPFRIFCVSETIVFFTVLDRFLFCESSCCEVFVHQTMLGGTMFQVFR
jgi:hypothetical protein